MALARWRWLALAGGGAIRHSSTVSPVCFARPSHRVGPVGLRGPDAARGCDVVVFGGSEALRVAFARPLARQHIWQCAPPSGCPAARCLSAARPLGCVGQCPGAHGAIVDQTLAGQRAYPVASPSGRHSDNAIAKDIHTVTRMQAEHCQTEPITSTAAANKVNANRQFQKQIQAIPSQV